MIVVGDLNLFLGLEINQTKKRIDAHQSKYAKELIKKFGMKSAKKLSTPITTNIKIDHDPKAKLVDPKHYTSVIDSLLYLSACRPNICFAVVVCTR